jgi:hypothetical protein
MQTAGFRRGELYLLSLLNDILLGWFIQKAKTLFSQTIFHGASYFNSHDLWCFESAGFKAFDDWALSEWR